MNMVTGSFPELQGAQNIMYEPRNDIPGASKFCPDMMKRVVASQTNMEKQRVLSA